jgi:hypothetical protein
MREIIEAITVEILTPARPEIMKLWFSRCLPIRVVPVWFMLMAAGSLG